MQVLEARAQGRSPFRRNAGAAGKKDKGKRPPRAPTAYNNYIKQVQEQVKGQVRVELTGCCVRACGACLLCVCVCVCVCVCGAPGCCVSECVCVCVRVCAFSELR